ncbi:MAG: hypothetical protein HKN45_07235 [Flavobacteriales bacterium]|nr:hypothetical protein [Flavobacteriales bacterium]
MIFHPLLFLSIASILVSCGSESNVSEAEVERAVEAITTEEEIQLVEEEKQSEIAHMDEQEAEVYIQKVEEEKARVEAKVAASPYLEYAEDLGGIVVHLKGLIDDAEGDCPKINAFMNFWNEHREDPIFLSAMKDKAIKKDVTIQYKRALKIKGNCKDP